MKNLIKEEAIKKYSGLYWSSLKMDESYLFKESLMNFYKRVKKVLLITHKGVITVIQCLINGWKYSNLLKIGIPTGSLIKFN